MVSVGPEALRPVIHDTSDEGFDQAESAVYAQYLLNENLNWPDILHGVNNLS